MKQVSLPSNVKPHGGCLASVLQAVACCVASSIPWDSQRNVGRIMPRMVNVGVLVSAWGQHRQIRMGWGMLVPLRLSPFCYQSTSEQGCASLGTYSSHALKGMGSKAGRGNRKSPGCTLWAAGLCSRDPPYWSILLPRLPLLDPWFDSLHLSA